MMASIKKQLLFMLCIFGTVNSVIGMEPADSADNSLFNWKTGTLVLATVGVACYAYSRPTPVPGECHFPARDTVAASDQPKAIVWDVGDVLFSADKQQIATKELGIWNLLKYMATTGRNPSHLFQRTNELLKELGEQTGPEEHKLRTPEGLIAPQSYADMQTGVSTPAYAYEQATGLMHRLFMEGQIGACEKTMLLAMCKLMHDPETLLRYLRADKEGVDLIEECATDPGCKQFVLTNWNSTAFWSFFKSDEGQKVFRHIRAYDCMTSGGQGVVKPDPRLFEIFIKKYGIEPQHAVLIDDVKANIETAKRCGFNTIHFQNMTFAQVREILIREGYLQPAI